MKGRARETAERAGEKTRELGERVREETSEAVETGRERVAGGLSRAGERLEERGRSLEERGGVRGRVGGAVHRAGDALESGAEYVRTTRFSTFRDDVKGQIRSHPFLSVGLALGTGIMLGRAFGGNGEEEEERERPDSERRERPGVMRQVSAPLGRALVGGMSAMVAKRVRQRIGGRSNC